MAALPASQALTGASSVAEEGHTPSTVLLYTQDLWRCGLCLVFSESQLRGLCWRRLWKGRQVRRTAFQAMSHWEHRLRREHLPQETISLQFRHRVTSPGCLQPRASRLLPHPFSQLKQS